MQVPAEKTPGGSGLLSSSETQQSQQLRQQRTNSRLVCSTAGPQQRQTHSKIWEEEKTWAAGEQVCRTPALTNLKAHGRGVQEGGLKTTGEPPAE